MELLSAAQGIDLLRPLKKLDPDRKDHAADPAQGTARGMWTARFSDDLMHLETLIESYELNGLIT